MRWKVALDSDLERQLFTNIIFCDVSVFVRSNSWRSLAQQAICVKNRDVNVSK